MAVNAACDGGNTTSGGSTSSKYAPVKSVFANVKVNLNTLSVEVSVCSVATAALKKGAGSTVKRTVYSEL